MDYTHPLACLAIFVLNWSAERYGTTTLARAVFWITALSPVFLLVYILVTTSAETKADVAYRELLIFMLLLYSAGTTLVAWLGRRAARMPHSL
jgi:hypothetical protein